MLLVVKLRLEKILVFAEHVLRQLVLAVHTVLDAVEALLHAEVEQIVDRHAEDLRELRQQRDVRHRGAVFPFRHGLRADADALGELLLRQRGLEAQLFDFLSQFHGDDLLVL